jgi:hypothetical protein
VKEYGMTLEEFSIVAMCNSTFTEVFRPDDNEEETDKMIYMAISGTSVDKTPELPYEDKNGIIKHDSHNPVCKCINRVAIKKANIDFYRTSIYATTRRDGFHIVSNLSRKMLNQTGDGHFTTIVAFHQKSDYILLLETARFKYNSMWFKIPQVFESMKHIDATTDKSRGFILCSKYY